MRACVLTVVHVYDDNRIFFKQIPSLLQAGYQVTYIASCPPEAKSPEGVDLVPLPRLPRSRRSLNWWRALRAALRSKADIYHLHDPELIGAGLLLKTLTSRPVVYDVHENYPQVMRRRRWIPALFRPAAAWAIGALERLAAPFGVGWGLICQTHFTTKESLPQFSIENGTVSSLRNGEEAKSVRIEEWGEVTNVFCNHPDQE